MMKPNSKCLYFAVNMFLIAGMATPDTSGARQTPAREEPSVSIYLRQRQYKAVQVGELRDPDVAHLAFTNYKALDGTTVTVIHHEFPSAVSAKEYLEKRIARERALNILESGKKRDSKNQDVGTRLQGELRTDQPSGSIQAIFWTNGPHYYEVTSLSKKDTLEFEKLYQ
jgi:hypothetical protein